MGSESKPESENPPKLSLPTKTTVQVALASFVNDFACRRNGTINRRLLSVLSPVSHPNPAPINGVSSFNVDIDPSRHLWVRVYVPQTTVLPTTSSLPVIVFFHGGGFAFLSPSTVHYDSACRRFARQIPAVVVSVNYRLSPEHRYPAAYDDGVDVLHFLNSQDPKVQFLLEISDLSKTFLAGDSAGANIAHNVARRWTAEERQAPKVRVLGLVAIQPFFGGEERVNSEQRLKKAPLVNTRRTDWMWKAFLPEGEDRDHEAANVFGPKSEKVVLGLEFPAVMVVIGGFDPLQDWQRRYVEGLRKRGKEVKVVEYENGIHAFYLFKELPEASLLVEEVKVFVQSRSCSGDVGNVVRPAK